MKRFRLIYRSEPATAAADSRGILNERCLVVRRAIAELPFKEREAVVLFYLEQRSSEEMCQILHASHNAVAVRLHRARQRLAVSLRELIAEESTRMIEDYGNF